MKYKKHILFFLLITFCITDCKKYPEGPCISLRGATRRIRGDWNVETVLIDNADSTGIGHNRGGYTIGYKGEDYSKIGRNGRDGRLSFDGRTHIIVTRVYGYPPLFLYPDDTEWAIQRLTNKEFWLKTTYNNKEYYLKLKKTTDYCGFL
ncbi:MAG: hypothetical protein HY063_06575 [Bacteroidetes bacterium]|nr:hypothetical protein [Bacteroidota bacterium]